MEDTCTCGDVMDEHSYTVSGPGACTVEGCDCIQYEADEDDDDESDRATNHMKKVSE